MPTSTIRRTAPKPAARKKMTTAQRKTIADATKASAKARDAAKALAGRTETFLAVLEAVSAGELVDEAAQKRGTTAKTIRQWAATDLEMSAIYARARESQCHALAEQAITRSKAARNGTSEQISGDKLYVDTLKWYTSKLAPKIFGEKLDLTTDGKRIQSAVVILPALDPTEPE